MPGTPTAPDHSPARATSEPEPTTTHTTGFRSAGSALAAGCPAAERTVSVSVGDFQISPSWAKTPDCSGYSFGMDVTGTGSKGQAQLGISLKGTAKILSGSGSVTAGASGSSASASVDLDTNGTVGGQAGATQAGGAVFALHISWDALKTDEMFMLGDVPFVLRLGLPVIIEPRFSGKPDYVSGTFLRFQCSGTLSITVGAIPAQSICSLSPAAVDAFRSLAPSAIVFAAGPKIGLGPGIAVGNKATVFAGFFFTFAGAVGITTTGAAASMVEQCLQIDRSFQVNRRGGGAFRLRHFRATDHLGEEAHRLRGFRLPEITDQVNGPARSDSSVRRRSERMGR